MITNKEFELILYFFAFLVFVCFVTLIRTREFKEFAGDLFLSEKVSHNEFTTVTEKAPSFNIVNHISSDTEIIKIEMNNFVNFRYDQLESVFSLKENEIVISFSFKEQVEADPIGKTLAESPYFELEVCDEPESSKRISPHKIQEMASKIFRPSMDFSAALA
ncbi:hypothetical protein N5D77_22935 [Comamonas thiooxydans]|uniref:Uncharacterized protein n=1 Tax=Comamonas thiooxydans TaxID=363952 RepID=A0AA42TUU3_9BURK|nr:hypothetical protein [Comamonas thiooxydans]MDH1337036.1 hypothetical protein [Comamonas thiooxydans]MDH1743197.1 hypothetical protein [Comamonas thiooxydans]MDH1789437.1 hypothetical protein [Comamonas thiooxydans]